MIQKRLLVLANSYKGNGRCIAGREIVAVGRDGYRLGSWIRPVGTDHQGELHEPQRRYHNGAFVEVLDIAEFPLIGTANERCQPENYKIPNSFFWRNVTSGYERYDLSYLEEGPIDLWLQAHEPSDRVSHSFAIQTPPEHSLHIIRPKHFRLCLESKMRDGKSKTCWRAVFEYRGTEYDLSFTDPKIRARFEPQVPKSYHEPSEIRLPCGDHLLICVSLARPWQGYHYKVVATIFEGIV